jgi:hypothetical protein
MWRIFSVHGRSTFRKAFKQVQTLALNLARKWRDACQGTEAPPV